MVGGWVEGHETVTTSHLVEGNNPTTFENMGSNRGQSFKIQLQIDTRTSGI